MLLFIPSMTSHPHAPVTLSQILMSFTKSSRHIADAQRHYQVTADSQWTRAPEFPVGSQAFVKAQFFHTTQPSKKLSDKFLGLSEILAHLGTYLVTL